MNLGKAQKVDIEKGIKHWTISKALLLFKRDKNADASCKLADYLLAMEWPKTKLSRTFMTTKSLKDSLTEFGDSVNNAIKFMLDIRKMQGSHSNLNIDTDTMELRIEFTSNVKLYIFAVEISYKYGFKDAKFKGTKLIPIVENKDSITQSQFKRISCYSGWEYFKNLVESIDLLIIESEKKIPEPLDVKLIDGNKSKCYCLDLYL